MINIEYDRMAAVEYAKKWALSRNPIYYDYEQIGGDCTNFISQCVYAGCGVMNYNENNGWYYLDANNKSPSWSGVSFFYDF
ncbi:MAG: amidase domain-containing protein, partial [Clostridia bacterium]|nr:amidase domain-containing protein [Clostridia bacterium]